MSPLLKRIILRSAAQDTIDKKWIDRLRKAWKDWVTRSESEQDVAAFLKTWVDWVKSLARDMAFSKGFFTFLRVEGKTDIYEMKVKAMEHLKSVATLMIKGIEASKFWSDVITPGTAEFRMGAGHRLALLQNLAKKKGIPLPQNIQEADELAQKMNLFEPARAQQLKAVLAEIAERTDAEFSRQFLALLTRVVNKKGPLEWGTSEREFHIGDVKVFMVDLPNVFPSEKKEQRSPWAVQRYIEQLQKAQALLERKGLGYLWYGPMYVSCKDCGGDNHLGKSYGVGANYHPIKDFVTIFQDPVRGLFKLIAHELGHRYYFRFMSQADRARFGILFGDVPAVSEYGGMNAEEDFAEVFSYYIDGQDLTPQQLQRFKQFLGRKKRSSFKDARTCKA